MKILKNLKIDFVIKIAELNNGIGPTTAYTKEIFSEYNQLGVCVWAVKNDRIDLLFN
jgi:hypothetical protein